jgi:hypothetical protein
LRGVFSSDKLVVQHDDLAACGSVYQQRQLVGRNTPRTRFKNTRCFVRYKEHSTMTICAGCSRWWYPRAVAVHLHSEAQACVTTFDSMDGRKRSFHFLVVLWRAPANTRALTELCCASIDIEDGRDDVSRRKSCKCEESEFTGCSPSRATVKKESWSRQPQPFCTSRDIITDSPHASSPGALVSGADCEPHHTFPKLR